VSASNLAVETEEGPYVVHLLRDAQGTHDTLEMAKGLIQLSTKQDAPAPRRKDVPALTPRQLGSEAALRGQERQEGRRGALPLPGDDQKPHQGNARGLGAHSQLEALAKARQFGIL
jgi:hypothetical protein